MKVSILTAAILAMLSTGALAQDCPAERIEVAGEVINCPVSPMARMTITGLHKSDIGSDIPSPAQVIGFKADGSGLVGHGVDLGDGLTATACHLVTAADRIRSGNRPAKVAASDVEADVCLLTRSTGQPLNSVVSLRSAVVGESVTVVADGFETSGVVLAVAGSWLELSAAWPEGVSGAGVYGNDGALLGLTAGFIDQGTGISTYYASSSSVIGQLLK